MSKNKKEASFKATMELSQAVAYLQDIAASLKAGTVCVTNCEKRVVLKPETSVRLGFEAVQRFDREALKIEISWRRETAPDHDVRLSITADDPEPEPEDEEGLVAEGAAEED